MNYVHIYRSRPWQPMTRHWHPYLEKWINTPPRKKYRCHECGDERQARSLEISIDYDRLRIRCKGGKHPGWV